MCRTKTDDFNFIRKYDSNKNMVFYKTSDNKVDWTRNYNDRNLLSIHSDKVHSIIRNFEYDDKDRLIKESATDGYVMIRIYDDEHNSVEQIDNAGNHTIKFYNDLNQKIKEINQYKEEYLTYQDKLLTAKEIYKIDHFDNKRRLYYRENYDYDDGKIIIIRNSLGLEQNYHYNDNGLCDSYTTSRGIDEEYLYNNKNQKVKTINHVNESEINYKYDDRGNLSVIKEPHRNTYRFYNEDNLLTKEIDNIYYRYYDYEDNLLTHYHRKYRRDLRNGS